MANEILQDMLDDVDPKYDKRVGSFVYDVLAPTSTVFKDLSNKLEDLEKKFVIENLSGDELAQRVSERTGIERRAATKAIGEVTVTGTGTIGTGDLFETEGGVQFEATETKVITTTGTVNVRCLESGPIGEVPASTIILFPVTLAGFTDVINAEAMFDGFEEESDADLLQRYYEYIRNPATSGNMAHYVLWSKEIEGVGEVKVVSLWDGNNTVKVYIIDANRQPASIELIETVQEYLDPDIEGLGLGQAPIGAFVTVESATPLAIDITLDIALSEGFIEEDVLESIEENLTAYLFDIAFKENIVSYAKVGSEILNTDGVEDYANLEINGGVINIDIEFEEVAILGEVTVNGGL